VTVGIQFAKNAQQTFSVMSVWKDSPADKAGIRLGDRITAVNGDSSRAMTTDELSRKLHGPEGTGVNLILERNGDFSAVSLKTRPMLCQEPMRSNSLRAAKP
jgi:carboxyl-terminal processing protease